MFIIGICFINLRFRGCKKPSVNLRKAPSTWKAIARAALTDGEKNALINKFNPDDFITADILPKKYQLTKVKISSNSFYSNRIYTYFRKSI